MPVEGRAVSKIQLVAVPKDGVQAVLKVEELEGCEHRTYDDSNDNGDDDDEDDVMMMMVMMVMPLMIKGKHVSVITKYYVILECR